MKKEVRPNFLEFFFVRWHFPFKHLDMQKMSLFVCLSRTQRRCHFSKHQTWCQARFGFCVRARCLGAKFQLNILSTFILEVTCLGAFSRESNGARTHIDVKHQKESGHAWWQVMVRALTIWKIFGPAVYTATLWTRTTLWERALPIYAIKIEINLNWAWLIAFYYFASLFSPFSGKIRVCFLKEIGSYKLFSIAKSEKIDENRTVVT